MEVFQQALLYTLWSIKIYEIVNNYELKIEYLGVEYDSRLPWLMIIIYCNIGLNANNPSFKVSGRVNFL